MENKDLLLQDLCARLTYEVKIDVTYSKESGSSLRSRLCSEEINVGNYIQLYTFNHYQYRKILIHKKEERMLHTKIGMQQRA